MFYIKFMVGYGNVYWSKAPAPPPETSRSAKKPCHAAFVMSIVSFSLKFISQFYLLVRYNSKKSCRVLIFSHQDTIITLPSSVFCFRHDIH